MPGPLHPLHAAILAQDNAQVKALLEEGSDPNQVDQWDTPLLAAGGATSAINVAIASENDEALALLLEHGAGVNHGEPQPPVMVAIATGRLSALKLLHAKGAWLEEAHLGEDGGTLLHMASNLGHAAIVKWLIEQGLDKEALDCYQHTPLLMACEGAIHSHHVDVAIALLQAGANPQHPKAGHVAEGSACSPTQPLGWAIDHGDLRLIEALLQAGADPNAAYGVAKGFSKPRSTLAAAITQHHTTATAVQRLIDAGAALDGRFEFDFNTGHMIDHERIAQPWQWRDGSDTLNLLHLAAASDRWQEVRMLHAAGLGINDTTRLGETALHTFLRNTVREPTPDVERTLKTLLELGSDPNASGILGTTPLMLLAQRYNRLPGSERRTLAMMQALIDAGAKVDSRADNGMAALDVVLTACDETSAAARLLQAHLERHALQNATHPVTRPRRGGRL